MPALACSRELPVTPVDVVGREVEFLHNVGDARLHLRRARATADVSGEGDLPLPVQAHNLRGADAMRERYHVRQRD